MCHICHLLGISTEKIVIIFSYFAFFLEKTYLLDRITDNFLAYFHFEVNTRDPSDVFFVFRAQLPLELELLAIEFRIRLAQQTRECSPKEFHAVDVIQL